VDVIAPRVDVLVNTAQVGTHFTQALINQLPTARDLNATLLLAPAVHPTGPSGNFSINGAVSFENLFLINGVTLKKLPPERRQTPRATERRIRAACAR
jgi:hypothetical protein